MAKQLLKERFQELAGINTTEMVGKVDYSHSKGAITIDQNFDTVKELMQRVLLEVQAQGPSIQYDAVEVESKIIELINMMKD